MRGREQGATETHDAAGGLRGIVVDTIGPGWLQDWGRGVWCIVGVWVVAASIWLFALMGWDKSRAKRGLGGSQRVWESTLLAWAIVGGGPGGFLGMHVFRHKTRHMRFRVVMPLAAIGGTIAALHFCDLAF